MISGLEKIKARFECEIEETLISKAYTYLQIESSSLLLKKDYYVDKDKEAILLATYIERNDLYFDDLRFSVYLDEGAEQKVFFYNEKSKVVKLNDAIFYVNWSQYFESLIVHNILFPETKYELLGFVKVNEILYSAISQDYIESTEKTKLDQVRSYMSAKGFTIKKKNDYVHSDLGIIIEDLHEENVLIKDDTLFFIDTVIYLK